MATSNKSWTNGLPKRPLACNICRERKIRCAGGNPCAHCLAHDEDCVFDSRRPRTKKRTMNTTTAPWRVNKVPPVPQETTRPTANSPKPSLHSARSTPPTTNQLPRTSQLGDQPTIEPWPTATYNAGQLSRRVPGYALPQCSDGSGVPAISKRGSHLASTTSQGPFEQTPLAKSINDDQVSNSSPAIPSQYLEGSSIYSSLMSGAEYHGPRQSMSICSKAGIDWVVNKVKSPSFQVTAQRVARDVGSRLKLDRPISSQRRPDPPVEDAWKYTSAYFEQAYDAALGVVHRPWFEARLRAHLSGVKYDDEFSWYALRNSIYATGCRILMNEKTTYRQAYQTSWPWFENALSVHTDLMFFQPNVMGVQALTIMAYFAEGASSPLLQYMLCSSALRLACAKGMHRQPAPSWNLPQEEISLRNFTFWAAYCLDKDIARRSGRPTAIEDDEISCEIPSHCPPGCSTNLLYFTAMVRFSQLSSVVSKRLCSAQALRQKPYELIQIVCELDGKLEELRRSLKESLGLELPLNLTKPPSALTTNQALNVQFSYYALLWDIHTTVTYPWLRGILDSRQYTISNPQIELSSTKVAETSSAAILDSKYVPIDASCPVLTCFFMPLYAIVNLFVHILQNPEDDSTQSNLILLEIAAGFFARLEFASGGIICLPFARDIASLARKAVENYHAAAKQTHSNDMDTEHVPSMQEAVLETPFATDGSVLAADGINEDWLGMNVNDGIEMWSVMVPGLVPDNYLSNSFL